MKCDNPFSSMLGRYAVMGTGYVVLGTGYWYKVRCVGHGVRCPGHILVVYGTLFWVPGVPMQGHASSTRYSVMGMGYGVECTGCVAAGACQWHKVCCATSWVQLK